MVSACILTKYDMILYAWMMIIHHTNEELLVMNCIEQHRRVEFQKYFGKLIKNESIKIKNFNFVF